jgi:hypothetical protein
VKPVRTLALLAVVAACHPMRVSGALSSDGGTLGSWDFTPGACSSGETYEFYGVDLTDGARNVRLVNDSAQGWVVAVSLSGDAGDPSTLLDAGVCGTLDASLGTPDDGSLGGDLSLDCATPGGGALSGSLHFRNCPAP